MSTGQSPEPQQQQTAPQASPAATAAAALIVSGAQVHLTAPGQPSPPPKRVFPTTSVQHRVLACVNDGTHNRVLGARNHLAAIADYCIHESVVINAPEPNERFDIANLTLIDQIQKVLDHLGELVDAGLLSRDGDAADANAVYRLTDEGVAELQAGAIPVPEDRIGPDTAGQNVEGQAYAEPPADRPIEQQIAQPEQGQVAQQPQPAPLEQQQAPPQSPSQPAGG